jgi:nicotinate dehydrogenase subunit B
LVGLAPFTLSQGFRYDHSHRFYSSEARDAPSKPSSQLARKGFGFARLNKYGAYVAIAADVDAKGDRAVRVLRAVDCGELTNPDGVRNQIEGGIVQAASWTLLESVDFDRKRIKSTDWDSYPIPRNTDAPEVEVLLIDQPREPYLGIGEVAKGAAGAAVANAVPWRLVGASGHCP